MIFLSWWNLEILFLLLCFGGTYIVHFSLIVSSATCRYNFTDVPRKEVSQSIVLRDSLSLGQFALLKSSVSIRVDGGFKY